MQESGNKSRPSQHSLSIRTKPDGFSFCSTTARGDLFKELKMPTRFDFPERFEEFVHLRGWAEKENLQVTLIDFSDRFMILPDKVTEDEQIKTFFNFQFHHEEETQILKVVLCDGKQIFCWEMPSDRDQLFEQLFPRLTILSSAYLLANWTIRQASIKQKPMLVAHLYEKSMQVFAANAQMLLFANTFPIKNIQEIPYFLLRCMDQLSFDPVTTNCIFCPESVSEEDLLEIFSPYIKHIRMAHFTHHINEPLQLSENK